MQSLVSQSCMIQAYLSTETIKKKIMLDSTNSDGTKHHRSGAPESAGEILRGEAGFSGRYGPRWTDGNRSCVSIVDMQMQHKKGCPECDPW